MLRVWHEYDSLCGLSYLFVMVSCTVLQSNSGIGIKDNHVVSADSVTTSIIRNIFPNDAIF